MTRILVLILCVSLCVSSWAQSGVIFGRGSGSGDPGFQERAATGLGSLDTWTLGAGATKVAAVETDDGDTSYIFSATANQTQRFTFSVFSIPAGATNIAVYVRAVCRRSDTANPGTIRSNILVGGTTASGSNQTLTDTYTQYDLSGSTPTINPKTTVAWTVDDVNGVGTNALEQFGVNRVSATSATESRCTVVKARVTYTP